MRVMSHNTLSKSGPLLASPASFTHGPHPPPLVAEQAHRPGAQQGSTAALSAPAFKHSRRLLPPPLLCGELAQAGVLVRLALRGAHAQGWARAILHASLHMTLQRASSPSRTVACPLGGSNQHARVGVLMLAWAWSWPRTLSTTEGCDGCVGGCIPKLFASAPGPQQSICLISQTDLKSKITGTPCPWSCRRTKPLGHTEWCHPVSSQGRMGHKIPRDSMHSRAHVCDARLLRQPAPHTAPPLAKARKDATQAMPAGRTSSSSSRSRATRSAAACAMSAALSSKEATSSARGTRRYGCYAWTYTCWLYDVK